MKIAIDLGGTNVRVGLIENGKVKDIFVRPCPSQMSCEDSIQYLKEMVSSCMHTSVTGIGIGVPSVVDSEKGIVYNAANIPAWKEVHLKEEMEKQYGIPVAVNNDANCFALGEHLFGAGKAYKNMVGITLGTGTGGGLILNGKLYNGSNTGAAEIGSLPYRDHDFEYYCSSNFFSAIYHTTGQKTFDDAQAGHPEAQQIWKTFGNHLGELVKAVLFAYDPEAIVWGGGLSGAYSLFEPNIRETLNSFPYSESVRKLHMAVSQTPYVSLLGASALIEPSVSSLNTL